MLLFLLLVLLLLLLLLFQRAGITYSRGNAKAMTLSNGRSYFTSLSFPWFLVGLYFRQKGGHCRYVILAAFSVIKATTRKVLSRIAKTLDSIILNKNIFQCKGWGWGDTMTIFTICPIFWWCLIIIRVESYQLEITSDHTSSEED